MRWCTSLTNGISLVEPNENLSKAYLEKAKNALLASNSLKGNREWQVSSCYYSMYFSLYSVMMKFGVKCENHACSIEFMRVFLAEKFTKEESYLLKKSMTARVDTQYYSDRDLDEASMRKMIAFAPLFMVKCKETANSLSQEEINIIRSKLKAFL